jgi:predicted HAD superfamily Cof-like phosphohydrolase
MDYAATVTEFRNAFEMQDDKELWKRLMNEESNEVIEAFANLIKEICDLVYVSCGAQGVGVEQGAVLPPEFQKNYDLAVAIVEYLSIPDEAFYEFFAAVHKSNMSKLGPDGKPIRREDGKILKGPNYAAPDIETMVREMFK